MRKLLIILCLTASSVLISMNKSANDTNQSVGDTYKENCNTKKISCECYTPPFYNLKNDWSLTFDGDFLYWYARETNLSYAGNITTVRATTDPAVTTLVFCLNSLENFDTKWDPGFRVGLGWNSDCDGWDFRLDWTYMHNHNKNSTSTPASTFSIPDEGESALVNPWICTSFNPGSAGTNIFFTDIVANWKLNFNSIDLDVGRKYWLSKCFNLRPYAGLRGAWTRTEFSTFSTANRIFSTAPITLSSEFFKDTFISKYWGVGLMGGLQPTLNFFSNIALFGNFGAALLWGDFEIRKDEDYFRLVPTGVTFVDYTNQARNDFYQMQAILDLAIGLRWEETWDCERFRTALDIGWEHHIWFDHNHRFKTADSLFIPVAPTTLGFQSYSEATGTLGLGGLTARFSFDF